MNKHYVYIIFSTNFSKYYKGYSANPQKRLAEHNEKKSRYTQHYTPWELGLKNRTTQEAYFKILHIPRNKLIV
jgi:predicted GIY-YIG superfamily endonuclease